jgi:VWFA-related protein
MRSGGRQYGGMCGRVCPVLGIFCAALAVCQQPQNTAEMAQHDTPVTFSTAVNLVLVPVVVRDAKGIAVGNLTKDDFQLYDKGKLQTIVRFNIDKAEAPPMVPDTSIETDEDGNPRQKPPGTPTAQPIAQRFVAWLYDDVHLSFGDLAQTRVAAIRVLTESFEPGTRAAIYTTSGRTTLDFTDDREKLKETLNLIRPSPTAVAGMAECPDISYFQADQLINLNDAQALQAGEAEYVACNPPPPNVSTAQAMAQAEPIVRGLAFRALDLGNNDTNLNLGVLKQVVRRIAVMPGSRSIVLISPGFHLTSDHRSEETDVIDRAIRANVTVNSLDARGLYTVIPGGNADTPGGVSPQATNVKMQYQIESATSDADVMAEFASATGGAFFQNSNDYFGGFKRIAAQPEYIYVLGFAPQNLKIDGSYHTLKVSLKNGAGLQVQARRGYFVRKHSDDAAEQAKEEVKEAFFSRDEVRDLPVELHTQFFKTGEYNAKLSIMARINIKHLHYRKAEGRNNDTLTVVGGVFDRNGNYVAGAQKTIDMKLKDQTLESIPETGITVKTSLDVKSGSYIVRLVVRDSEGQVMSAQNGALEIP